MGLKLRGVKISDSEMKKYVEGWRRRADQARRRMEEQAQEAFTAAKHLAGMLAAEPGVKSGASGAKKEKRYAKVLIHWS